MAIGEDRGERHRMSLSHLATGHNALRGTNHAVPVLQELLHDDMIFAVFPLLSRGFNHPWFYRFSEVLGAVEQILEVTVFPNLLVSFVLSLFKQGIDFCHDQLVAHLVRAFSPVSANAPPLTFHRILIPTTSLSTGREPDANLQNP